jgi:uncharacterized protein (TIGR03435 family)
MTQLALNLRTILQSPVVNQTGINGTYDFMALDGVDVRATAPLSGVSSPETTIPIFSALQEKLGLKLEPHKIQVHIVVIDHAEMPSE